MKSGRVPAQLGQAARIQVRILGPHLDALDRRAELVAWAPSLGELHAKGRSPEYRAEYLAAPAVAHFDLAVGPHDLVAARMATGEGR